VVEAVTTERGHGGASDTVAIGGARADFRMPSAGQYSRELQYVHDTATSA